MDDNIIVFGSISSSCKPLECPSCKCTTQTVELGNMEVMYEIKGVYEDGSLEFGGREDVDGSYMELDYPLYCRNCEARWRYDWKTGKTEMMPEWEPNNDK